MSANDGAVPTPDDPPAYTAQQKATAPQAPLKETPTVVKDAAAVPAAVKDAAAAPAAVKDAATAPKAVKDAAAAKQTPTATNAAVATATTKDAAAAASAAKGTAPATAVKGTAPATVAPQGTAVSAKGTAAAVKDTAAAAPAAKTSAPNTAAKAAVSTPGSEGKSSGGGDKSSGIPASQRLLSLCQKGDWPGVEQLIRHLERAQVVGSGGGSIAIAGAVDEVISLLSGG